MYKKLENGFSVEKEGNAVVILSPETMSIKNNELKTNSSEIDEVSESIRFETKEGVKIVRTVKTSKKRVCSVKRSTPMVLILIVSVLGVGLLLLVANEIYIGKASLNEYLHQILTFVVAAGFFKK